MIRVSSPLPDTTRWKVTDTQSSCGAWWKRASLRFKYESIIFGSPVPPAPPLPPPVPPPFFPGSFPIVSSGYRLASDGRSSIRLTFSRHVPQLTMCAAVQWSRLSAAFSGKYITWSVSTLRHCPWHELKICFRNSSRRSSVFTFKLGLPDANDFWLIKLRLCGSWRKSFASLRAFNNLFSTAERFESITWAISSG